MNSDPNRTQPTYPDTVLVVEDEVLVRVVISEYLRRCDTRLSKRSARTRHSGLAEGDLRVDVVFSDIEMSARWTGSVCRAGFTIIGELQIS